MIRRLLAFFLAVALCLPAEAGWLPLVKTSSGGGGCTQATTFLARLTNHTNDANYTTMICGMVTDGVWAKLDLLYIFAANNSTDALLNLPSVVTTSLSATAPTFTANTGFAGNGASASIDVTGYTFSAGTNFVTASASMFAWSTESGADNGYIVGNSGNFNSTEFLQPFSFGSVTNSTINAGTAFASSTSITSGLGLFTTSLVSGVITGYQNTTSTGTQATTPATPNAVNPWFLGSNGLGWYGGNIAVGGLGGGLSSTDVTNLYGRVHTFLHAVNPTTFP